MPVIEQVLYGHAPGQTHRAVLARSPGIARDGLVEITRFCENWGEAPPEGLRRPVLMSFPLCSGLPDLTGRQYAVIRIARGVDPLHHAVVLDEAGYAAFGRNPYVLAQERIFADRWEVGTSVERRRVAQQSLAPLVSPLPSEADCGLVDEALRQLLASGKLLLPLAAPDERSDRLLALLVLAMPLALKRDLRFASWAPGGGNAYVLAARGAENAQLASWSRLLMTMPSGRLAPVNERYVNDVREALLAGDLGALEQLSAHGHVDLDIGTEALRPRLPGTVTAMMRVAPQPRARGGPARGFLVRPAALVGRGRAAVAARGAATGEPLTENADLQAVRERRGGVHGRRSARRTRLLLTIATLALTIAGGWWLVNPALVAGLAHRGLRVARRGEEAAAMTGVDVVSLVRELQARGGSARGGGTGDDRTVTELHERAARPLRAAGQLLVDDVNACQEADLSAPAAVDDLRALAYRGAVIEREIMRLQLAGRAVARGEDFGAVGLLPGPELREDWERVQRRDPAGLSRAGDELDVNDLLMGVRAAARQAAALADVVSLLRQPRRDGDWERRLESAAARLPTRNSPAVSAHRAAARDLARLKRAEQAEGFEHLAFAPGYGELAWFPAAVKRVLGTDPAADAERRARDGQPRLAVASWRFHADLLCLPELVRDGDQVAMLATLAALEGNPAVRFDPGTYRDHVDRSRLVLAEALIRRGADPQSLPEAFFPAGDRTACLEFLRLLDSPRTADEWQTLGDRAGHPFLTRWARRAAASAARQRQSRAAEFDAAFTEVMRLAGLVQQRVADGEDWGDPIVDLGPAIAKARGLWPVVAEERTAAATYLHHLERMLERPLPVRLTGFTVQLPPGALAQPTPLVLDLRLDGGGSLRSEPFLAAPATGGDDGWLGTCPLDWTFDLPPDMGLRVTVRPASGGDPLLETRYPALRVGAGAAALVRARDAGHGSTVFRAAGDPGLLLDWPPTP
ncbi:MAG: hypothetical protein R6X25_16315 [Candidatus Krumholzibacteriia bacterium]